MTNTIKKVHIYILCSMSIALLCQCTSNSVPSSNEMPVILQQDDMEPRDGILILIDQGQINTQNDQGIYRLDQTIPSDERPTYDFSSVDTEMNSFIDANPAIKGAGIAIMTREQGVLYQKAYGEFSPDRVYLVASSSKMVSAGILNTLHDQELLDLNEPLADFIEWGGGSSFDYNGSITV